MKLSCTFMESKFPKEKEISLTSTHQSFPSRFHKFVPVVIERYKKNHAPCLQEKFKFRASGDMTVSQLVSILRHRMRLSSSQGYHLLYNKGRTAVMMSQLLGKISSEYKDSMGILCFIFAAQNTFGCPVPRVKPIKSKFPGIEPNPLGAPEPNEEVDFLEEMNVHALYQQYIQNGSPPLPSTHQPVINTTYTPFPLPLLAAHVTMMANSFTQTDTDTVLYAVPDETSGFSLVPMEVAQSPIPESLPLASLIQELNHIVPLWHIQLLPTFPQSAILQTTLTSSLTRLVLALQNHVPSQQGLIALQNLPPPSHTLMQHFMSNFLPHPVPSLAVPETGAQASLDELASHTSVALELANQAVAGLQDPSYTPPVLDNFDGTVQLTVLIQYCNQVAQHIEFQNLVTASAGQPHPMALLTGSHENPHSEPTIIMPPENPLALFNPLNSWYPIDSDSLSEEDGDMEYFCDILL